MNRIERFRSSAQWRIFKTNRLALLCIFFLIFIYALSFLGPLFISDPFDVYDPYSMYQSPSAEHLFGTDRSGRDVFALTVYGGRMSLTVGFVATIISLVIGLIYGSIMGYYGGKVDYGMMQGILLVGAIPSIPLIVIIMGIFGRNIWIVMILIGILSWTGVALILRGQFFTYREREFVEAARAYGASTPRIIFKHILPNTLAPVWISAAFSCGTAIVTESTLSFLGLGVPFDTVSWGRLLALGREVMGVAPWVFVPSALLIFLASFSFIVLGETMRDAFDPKMRGVAVERVVELDRKKREKQERKERKNPSE